MKTATWLIVAVGNSRTVKGNIKVAELRKKLFLKVMAESGTVKVLRLQREPA